MHGIRYIGEFISSPEDLFRLLRDNVIWDTRMVARRTASFGVAYNYSQIHYPDTPFIPELINILNRIDDELGFEPNNCLINYYLDGSSKMGFHSDQIDILEEDTGIAILSVGETRTLRFRNIQDKNEVVDFELPSGSLIYMTQEVQHVWQHSIPSADTNEGRMSLTFRKMKL
ncbi:2OG-Fe(II) oxygenase superfamily protein [Chitinophaga sp. YR573]|uniref:alpha-ketoglutarate-dependent dioxygenase AlkB family protein n=1 Tax=Chitinophaga sp. YR573 TaxID=1881040 RepID=UPI0008CF0B4D|nr:alpha-ketoglutarate-dependent dioxygenase AlkB [Chitinophaga sp. YR573]SEW46306.1 2OG-Fe(II) oxygenase superfamily protein [Chitinophaga sp. YR573]